jgi:hypothetical protein
MEIVEAKLGSLKIYRNNPRKGNISLIAESLKTYGQYKPITVNKRTGEILAGNHTYQAAQTLGWATINAVYVDVDDETAAKIVAIDNRSSDLGTYDDEALLALLSEIEDLAHTGYTQDDLDDLLADIQEAATPVLEEAINRGTYAIVDPAEGGNVARIPTISELSERYNQKATRMVILDYPNDTYVWVIDRLSEYRQSNNIPTNAEALTHLLEQHYGEKAPE